MSKGTNQLLSSSPLTTLVLVLRATVIIVPALLGVYPSTDKKDDAVNKTRREDSIVEVFELSIDKNIVKVSIAYLSLVAITIFSPMEIGWRVLMLPLIPIGAFILIRFLTHYRIYNEYYGNNRYEALEMIKFIEKNSDDSDSSGGRRKKVFLSHQARRSRSFRRLEGIGDLA